MLARAAGVYTRHLCPNLTSLVLHGSVVKGGYIPGGSDVDIALFLKPDALRENGRLPLARVLALYRDLAEVDVAPFRYLNTYAYPEGSKPGIGFIPGAFRVVYGSRDVPVATEEELRQSAHESLATLDPGDADRRIARKLIGHAEGRAYAELRLLCTDVWPVLYHILCVQTGDPIRVWQLPKDEAVAAVEGDTDHGRLVRAFYGTVTEHYAAGETVDTALEALQLGVDFLYAASRWYAGRV